MIPNILSLSRIPLALLFLLSNPIVRLFAVLLAWITDILDGFLARRQGTTKLGTIIDPISDKFFALFSLSILFFEGSLDLLTLALLFSRDISLILFVGYLLLTRSFRQRRIQSFISGKIATGLQFITLIYIIVGIALPAWVQPGLLLIGISSLIELIYLHRRRLHHPIG